MEARALVFGAVVVAVTSTACSSRSLLRSTEPSPEPSQQSGLRYYMPRDVLLIDATATFNIGRGWSTTGAAKDFCSAGEAKVGLKSVVTEVAQNTVADTRVSYHVLMETSSSAAQNLKLAVTNDGLLTSLNYTVEDKRAEIAGNVLKSVAGIAGTVLGVDQMLPRGLRSLNKPAPRDRGETCALRADNVGMTDLLLTRDTLELELSRANREREQGLGAVTSAKSQAALKLLQARDDLQARRVSVLDGRLTMVRTAIAASVAKVKAESGISARDTVIKTEALLDLAVLPSTAAVAGKLGSLKDAHTALSGFGEAQRLLDSARIVLTVDELDAPGHAPMPSAAVRTWKLKDCDGLSSSSDCFHLYSRAPRPRILRLYVPTGGDASQPFTLHETRLVTLISSADPVTDVPVSTKTLGQQSLAMSFGRAGTLTGFEHTSSAGLASATSVLTTALTGARQEFVAGLQTAQTTQSTLDAIRAESRTSRLKELQDQKALIDAQLALEGTTATKAVIEQKQQIDAQIALETAKQALTTAEQSGTVSGDVAAMRAEIQQLQAQLDLLKIQIELEKTKKLAQTN